MNNLRIYEVYDQRDVFIGWEIETIVILDSKDIHNPLDLIPESHYYNFNATDSEKILRSGNFPFQNGTIKKLVFCGGANREARPEQSTSDIAGDIMQSIAKDVMSGLGKMFIDIGGKL